MSIKATSQVSLTDVTDAYSVTLTSEAYTFIGDTTGAPAGLSCETQAVAYRGTEKCSNVAISSVACPSGISSEISNNNTASPTITFTTTAIIEDSCEATIDIVVDEVEFTKKFSFAVAKEGSFPDDWYADADKTYINGGKIYTGSITSEQLSTNAIKSRNYVEGQSGTFLNLEDGIISNPNFRMDSNGIVCSAGFIGDWMIQNGALVYENGNTVTSLSGNSLSIGNTDIEKDIIAVYGQNDEPFTQITNDGIFTTGSIEIGDPEKMNGSLTCYGTVNANNIICPKYLQIGSSFDNNRNITWMCPGRSVWAGFANSNGGWYIWDSTHKKGVLYSDSSGNNTFYGHATSDLPLSGGTITGNLTLSGSNVIKLNAAHNQDAKIGAVWSDGSYHNILLKQASSNDVYFGIANTSGVKSETSLRGNTVRIYSHTKGAVYLGSSGSTAITSDENLKDLYDMDDRYEEFFMNLEPKAYIYKQNGHRKHMGFGARQVEDSLLKSGLTTEEFAGILKDTDVTISADEAGTDSDKHYDELYSLRYEEFIALNTHMIQKLMKRVDELEKKLANQ